MKLNAININSTYNYINKSNYVRDNNSNFKQVAPTFKSNNDFDNPANVMGCAIYSMIAAILILLIKGCSKMF